MSTAISSIVILRQIELQCFLHTYKGGYKLLFCLVCFVSVILIYSVAVKLPPKLPLLLLVFLLFLLLNSNEYCRIC